MDSYDTRRTFDPIPLERSASFADPLEDVEEVDYLGKFSVIIG